MHCTLVGNVAADAGGGLAVNYKLAASLENCIAWGNVAPMGAQLAQVWAYTNSLYVAYSDVQGGAAATWQQSSQVQSLIWAQGNLDADPRFVDATDWHLLFSSPCRDAADGAVQFAPDVDWEGDARPTGAAADIGADEFADRLYVTGAFRPGGGVEAKVLGTPGAVLQAVFLGRDLLDAPLHLQLGDWHLASPVLSIVLLVPLPADGLVTLPGTLPASVPGPYAVHLQALVDGQLGNVATLAVE